MSSREQHDQARSATTVRDLPIGIQASGTRQESDSMGTIEVPADHYWGGADAALPDPLLHWR
jgi:fumarate hydratase, class II